MHQKNFNMKNLKAGFTLIELMVVIVIAWMIWAASMFATQTSILSSESKSLKDTFNYLYEYINNWWLNTLRPGLDDSAKVNIYQWAEVLWKKWYSQEVDINLSTTFSEVWVIWDNTLTPTASVKKKEINIPVNSWNLWSNLVINELETVNTLRNRIIWAVAIKIPSINENEIDYTVELNELWETDLRVFYKDTGNTIFEYKYNAWLWRYDEFIEPWFAVNLSPGSSNNQKKLFWFTEKQFSWTSWASWDEWKYVDNTNFVTFKVAINWFERKCVLHNFWNSRTSSKNNIIFQNFSSIVYKKSYSSVRINELLTEWCDYDFVLPIVWK